MMFRFNPACPEDCKYWDNPLSGACPAHTPPKPDPEPEPEVVAPLLTVEPSEVVDLHADQPSQRTSSAPRSRLPAPRTGVTTRPPKDQNEHLWALINSHRFDVYAKAVGMIANNFLGAQAKGRPFHLAEKELTAEYLAMKAGCSKNKARDAMAGLVKAGFFQRVDNGQGGKRNVNKARYRATFPEYLS